MTAQEKLTKKLFLIGNIGLVADVLLGVIAYGDKLGLM